MTDVALSFSHQPALKDLFQHLQTSKAQFTIFCGAGVSVDSGLPTWRQLVAKLNSLVENDDIQEVIEADQATLTRKVGLILQLIKQEGQSEESIIARALYGTPKDRLKPGQLATAIARLAATLTSERVRIATTNYDDRLELALEELGLQAQPMGPRDVDAWNKSSFDGQSFNILHLHGLLSRDGTAQKGPIVLSESGYWLEGEQVQDQVKNMLQSSSTTLFVGVSMTDPSVVEPLSRLHKEETSYSAYTILVPDSASLSGDNPPGRRAHAYAIMLGDYLTKELGVQSIFLKSYSQVAQCLLEAATAIRYPAEYNSDDPVTSVRYGFRFERALRKIHDALHISEGCVPPSDDYAITLSESLHRSLYAHDGPITFVREFVSRRAIEEFEHLGIAKHYLYDEEFALLLWLRPMRAVYGHPPMPYKLLQVGTSAYAQREGRVFRRYHWVTGDARFVGPKCVYFGRSSIESLPLENEGDVDEPTWRSFLGTPLICTEDDVSTGTHSSFELTVGAAVLYSTRRIVDVAELQESRGDGFDVELRYHPSPMSLMNDEEQEELLRRVAAAGRRTLREQTTNDLPSRE